MKRGQGKEKRIKRKEQRRKTEEKRKKGGRKERMRKGEKKKGKRRGVMGGMRDSEYSAKQEGSLFLDLPELRPCSPVIHALEAAACLSIAQK